MREPCDIEDLGIQECENVIKSMRWQIKKLKGRRGFSNDPIQNVYCRELEEMFNAVNRQWVSLNDKLNG